MTAVYLGLGSNLGDREANLRRALELLGSKVKVLAVSSIYETEPVGFLSQPRFLNAVCRVETAMRPEELLLFVKSIEKGMGRKQSFRNAPREIDIDILLYGDEVMETPELVVPHPGLARRAFVLVPLVEIGPQVLHPVLRRTAAELAAEVDCGGVWKWGGAEGLLP